MTAHPIETESLAHFTELMNELLPVHEIVGDPQPAPESRENLLKDARTIRDVYAQERARAENQLLAAQQVVSALSTQLRIAEERLTTIEDLIGEVRTRMCTRGLNTHPIICRPLLKSVTGANVTNVSLPSLQIANPTPEN